MQDNKIAIVLHLAIAVGILTNPIIGTILTLLIWQISKRKSDFINNQGKEAVNFSLTVLLSFYALVVVIACISVFILSPLKLSQEFTRLLGITVGILLSAFKMICAVMASIAAIRVKNGVSYSYPICWRFIR